jgi:hypothetical protein
VVDLHHLLWPTYSASATVASLHHLLWPTCSTSTTTENRYDYFSFSQSFVSVFAKY